MAERIRRFWRAARSEPGFLRNWLAVRVLFTPLERLTGYHLTADHFYQPVPNTRLVARRYREDAYRFPLPEARLRAAEAAMLALLDRRGPEFRDWLRTGAFDPANTLFPAVDAFVLYALVRTHAPRTVLEVGQGHSTRVTLAALARNAAQSGMRPRFVSVDLVDRLGRSAVPEGVEFRSVVGDVTVTADAELVREADLLFLDTSHVLKWGSDVEWAFRVALPAVRPGTLIHFHDVFTPFDYPKHWLVEEKRFWNEQYVLEALLHGGDAFEIELPVHALCRLSEPVRRRLRDVLGAQAAERPGQSFWIRRRTDREGQPAPHTPTSAK